jgi:hypothetical protein
VGIDVSAAPLVSEALLPHAMLVNTTPKSHANAKAPMVCLALSFSVIPRIGSLLISTLCMLSLPLGPCNKQEAVHGPTCDCDG